MAHTWRSEENLQEPVLTQSIRRGSKFSYLSGSYILRELQTYTH